MTNRSEIDPAVASVGYHDGCDGTKTAIDSDCGFSHLQQRFHRAESEQPERVFESLYVLAGQVVRFRVVGHRLAEFMEMAFAHVRFKEEDAWAPGLTIELWDESDTGISCSLGSTRDDLDLHPNLRSSQDGRFASYQLQNSVVCLDLTDNHVVGRVSGAHKLTLYERGRPLHIPLSLWHKRLHMPLIHAGLVSKNGRGVLLTGPAGSGKSTSAITSACAGFNFLSDDLIGLQATSGKEFIGHSLYNSTFIDPEHLRRFPLLAPHAIKGRYAFEKKHLILLSEIRSLRFEHACRICAVVLPRVVNSRASTFHRASKGEALLALAPSSLLVGERSFGIEGFNRMSDLVESVPCYRLELGKDLEEIANTIEELLAEAAS